MNDHFYREILDNLADGVYFVDPERRITYWNRGAEIITGFTADEVVGRSCRDNILVHTDGDGVCLCQEGCPLQATIGDCACRKADVFLRHKDGHRVPVAVRVAPMLDSEGRTIGGVEVFSDNSSKLAALEKAAEMERLALIDPLTLAGNRRYTDQILQEQADWFQRGGDPFAILFLDLDQFKNINDEFGHLAGDTVLQAVARTIMNNLRSFDYLGRWGGEEFVAVITKADAARAAAVAQRCCALVRNCGVNWKGQLIHPTVSVGIAVIQFGESVADLIARADRNLYEAKRLGRDRCYGS